MVTAVLKNTIIFLVISVRVFSIASCEKENIAGNTPVAVDTPVCVIRGIYSGTNHASGGTSSTLTYDFRDNNFAVGRVTPTGPAVTFGGYSNTCDSVFLSVYYTWNSSYYTLRGKLSNNNTTITGSFINTTTSEYGTFTISK